MSLLVISLARKMRLDVVMEAWLGGSSILLPGGVYLFKKKKITILLFSIVPYSIKTEAVTKSDSPIRSTITEKHQALDNCYVEYI